MKSELSTNYLGMQLHSPVIVGSCPLTIEPETVRQFVEAGAGAIVLPSILQEQIVHAELQLTDPQAAAERSGYQPQQDKYNGGVERYLATIAQLKTTITVPVIASINVATAGNWLDYVKKIEASGAHALELNWQPIYIDPDESSEQVENTLCDIVHQVSTSVQIPVAVKINHCFANLASIARKLHGAGAQGLILFTHLPQWDVCVDRMHWTIRWELSPIDSLGRVLEGIVRARTGGLAIPIAASGGIRTAEDAIKTMVAGADVVMVTSEIYREGPEVIRKIVEGINQFLGTSPYESLQAFQQARPEVQLGPRRLMRLEYVDPLTRSDHFYDPTPLAATEIGDSFGHKL